MGEAARGRITPPVVGPDASPKQDRCADGTQGQPAVASDGASLMLEIRATDDESAFCSEHSGVDRNVIFVVAGEDALATGVGSHGEPVELVVVELRARPPSGVKDWVCRGAIIESWNS